MKLKEIIAHDSRGAALHEVAHAIVASKWGSTVVVTVFKADGVLNITTEKTVLGQGRYARPKSLMGRSAIGWAGGIGEALGADADADFYEILDQLESEYDILSDTDRQAVEAVAMVYRRRAARMAYDILWENRPALLAVSRYLVRSFARRGVAYAMWNQGKGWEGLNGFRIKIA